MIRSILKNSYNDHTGQKTKEDSSNRDKYRQKSPSRGTGLFLEKHFGIAESKGFVHHVIAPHKRKKRSTISLAKLRNDRILKRSEVDPLPVDQTKYNLTFSRRSIEFEINAGPEEKIFEQQEMIRIGNRSDTPIKATFIVQFPFSFYIKDHDFDYPTEYNYSFNENEEISVTLNFDARHLRKELEKITFTGKFKIFYNGIIEGENLPISGTINFPSAKPDKALVDFGVAVNHTEAVNDVTIDNVGLFTLTYKWYVKPNTTLITKTDMDIWEASKNLRENDLRITDPNTKIKYLEKALTGINTRTNTDLFAVLTSDATLMPRQSNETPLSLTSTWTTKTTNTATTALTNPTEDGKSLCGDGDELPFPGTYMRDTLHRMRLMNMLGLHDSEKEIIDENIVLKTTEPEAHPNAITALPEIFDIVPMAGVIQPGHRQKFTAVFYAHANIAFKTTLILSIEGGASKYVDFQGESSASFLAVYPKFINYGAVNYSKTVVRCFGVKNFGKMPVRVFINYKGKNNETEQEKLGGKLKVYPLSIRVRPGNYGIFTIEYTPEKIGPVHSSFWVEVKGCGSHKFDIEGFSCFSSVLVMLPRNFDCLPLVYVLGALSSLKIHEKGVFIDDFKDAQDSSRQSRQSTPSIKGKPNSCQRKHLKRRAKISIEKAFKVLSIIPKYLPLYAILNSFELESNPLFVPINYEVKNEEEDLELLEFDEQKYENFDLIEDELEGEESDSEWVDVSKDMTISILAFSHYINYKLVSAFLEKIFLDLKSKDRLQRIESKKTKLGKKKVFSSTALSYPFDTRKILYEVDLPPYILDIGDVFVGVRSEFPFNVGNPGLLPVTFRYDEVSEELKSIGIEFEPPEVVDLNPGGIAKLTLSIKYPCPVIKNLDDVEKLADKEYIYEEICLRVKEGVKIPILITGRAFYPTIKLTPENTALDKDANINQLYKFEDERSCLLFKNVPLWATSSAKFKLTNIKNKPEEVSLTFESINSVTFVPDPAFNEENEELERVGNGVFQIYPANLILPPFGHAFFNVDFTPQDTKPQSAIIFVISGMLQPKSAQVENSGSTEKLAKIEVRGEGSSFTYLQQSLQK